MGDVLDQVIERYSASEAWRDWETEWQAGRMSTPECLRRQMGDLRVSPEELHGFMSECEIDPAFPRIVAWAAAKGADLSIVSDNFSSLIHAILDHQELPAVPVFANEFVFAAGRFEARFPLRDPACPGCAHCKAQHLRAVEGRQRIFVGDGLSDVCPSLVADVVFAKDSLAADLGYRGVRIDPIARSTRCCITWRSITADRYRSDPRRAMSTAFVPPKAKELDMTARSATSRRASLGTKSRSHRGSGRERWQVGGIVPVRSAITAAMNSTAPEAPKRCPCSAFVDETATRSAAAPNASRIDCVSTRRRRASQCRAH